VKLVVGLGNPGQEYVYTRHNMGWASIDFLTRKRSLSVPVSKFKGEFWKDRDLLFLKPLTYMNLSGMAVREAFDFYKMDPSEVLVIYDDMALPYGQLRLRGRGSAGGHNGLISVLSCLGTLEIPRLRIGIGTPVSEFKERLSLAGGAGESKAHGDKVAWVLGHLTREELKGLPGILERVAESVEAWLSLDLERAMNRVNAKARS
jgi:PTH1 family peptidyl-tRNA hydrolase